MILDFPSLLIYFQAIFSRFGVIVGINYVYVLKFTQQCFWTRQLFSERFLYFDGVFSEEIMFRLVVGNSAVTFTEIMIAMLIFLIALLPQLGLLTNSMTRSEDVVAMSFVLERARHVMIALLEEVPFADISPGNPAVLSDSGSLLPQRLFPGAEDVDGGFVAEGIASCSRGIHYHIYLRAEPIIDTAEGVLDDELTFSFYSVPAFASQEGWELCVEDAEKEERNNSQPSILDPSVALPAHEVDTPYRFFPEGVAGVWGPEEEARNGAKRFDQRQIALPNADGEYYLMQRLVLQIRWNAASNFYDQPESDDGRPQRFHLIAYKANLD